MAHGNGGTTATRTAGTAPRSNFRTIESGLVRKLKLKRELMEKRAALDARIATCDAEIDSDTHELLAWGVLKNAAPAAKGGNTG